MYYFILYCSHSTHGHFSFIISIQRRTICIIFPLDYLWNENVALIHVQEIFMAILLSPTSHCVHCKPEVIMPYEYISHGMILSYFCRVLPRLLPFPHPSHQTLVTMVLHGPRIWRKLTKYQENPHLLEVLVKVWVVRRWWLVRSGR